MVTDSLYKPEWLEVLQVEAGVEKGEEGVHKLEYDQLQGDVGIVLFLSSKLGRCDQALIHYCI